MNHRNSLLRNIFLWSFVIIVLGCTAFNSFFVQTAHALGVTTTSYSIPSGNDPWGAAFNSKGNVWMAIPNCDPSPQCSASTPPGQLEVFNPATSSWIATYQLPQGYAQPLFLTFDAKGNEWFPLPMGNSIGMYNPTTNTYQQWPVPTASAGPWDIAIDQNGYIWFTEHYTNKIGRFDPVSQTFLEIATPASNSQPYGITVDKSNNIWFTENNSSVALIAEYTAGGQLLEYKIRNSLPGGSLTPHLITVDPNGNIWWSEGWVGMIGELQVNQAQPGTNAGVTEYPYTCATCGTHTSGISVDSNGVIWFDDSLQGIFGSFPGSGTGSFSTYSVGSASHPHDGLQVDSQNRIWFDEEFANKLAEAVQGANPTPTPTPPPTTLGPIVAQDTFQRPNQTYWGTASDSHTWGSDAGSNAIFSIQNNAGQVANGGAIYTGTLGSTITDGQVFFTGSAASFNTTDFGAVLRFTDGNDWYKAYIDGTNLLIRRNQNGNNVVLVNTPFPATAGTSYSLKFQAVGSSLAAKVWPTSGTEPSNWMLSTNDSTFSSGYAGLQVYEQNGSNVTYTSFNAYTVISGTPTPTPITTVTPTATPSPTITPTPTSGAVIAQDTFQRPNQSLWGTASDGNIWGADANNNTAFSITNNAGQVANGNSPFSATLGSSATDAQVVFTASVSALGNSNLGTVLRFTDTNNWYKAYIDGTNLILQKKVKGSTTILASVPFAATGGVSYALRFQIVGTTLSAKVWIANGTEPANWMATATDSSFASGYCGLRMQIPSGVSATYTSFTANTVINGTPTPSPSITPTPSPTSTPTPIPTPAPPAGGALVAQDTFQRPNQSLWGTASDGNIWGADANNNTAFSINNNAGQVASGNSSFSATLGSSATDTQVVFTASVSAFSNSNLGAVLRFTDTNNWYKAYIDGTNLILQRKVKGSTTILASVPFAATGGVSYALRFQIVGTTLSAKVWIANGTEPANWMATATDSSFASGYCGVRMQTPSGVSATYTSFTANTVINGTPTPSPSITPTPSPTSTPTPIPTPTPTPATSPTPSPTP